MIELDCSNCKTNLSIDDAFAGGVCRCQHCGTIQTVPKKGQAASAGSGATPQPLFKRKARIESALNPYSDNLDRAADDIESSGALTPSAVANLSPLKRPDPSNDSSSGSVSGLPFERKSGERMAGAAVKEPPATAPVKHFVPRPSASSATPPVVKTGSRKTGIVVVAVVGILLLAGSAYFAFSGETQTTEDPIPSVIPKPEAVPVTPPAQETAPEVTPPSPAEVKPEEAVSDVVETFPTAALNVAAAAVELTSVAAVQEVLQATTAAVVPEAALAPAVAPTSQPAAPAELPAVPEP